MELTEIIKQKVKNEGPICFQEFMEMCLYHADLGYYSSPQNKIGMDGDFYTSTCLTPVFGALIGKQLEEMWQTMGEPAFTVVEYGAGTGALCHDILTYLKGNKKMHDQLRYCIIEKSPAMRALEKKHLNEKVCWYDSIQEIPEINGCIISNELVDNFSVHQVVMEEELKEVFVDYQDGFVEVLKPASEVLQGYLSELGIELPQGFRTEINLQALSWISDVAAALNTGYVMTIDYGHQSAELYKACRSGGTLLCYYKHSINDCVFDNIGKQDITSHVNFSALMHWGGKNGLDHCGLTDQCHFLLALGFKDFINQEMSYEKDILQAAKKASILSHTLLIDMGNKFKVLIQKKGLNPQQRISGLKFNYAEES